MSTSRENRTPEVLALRAELETRNVYPHQLAAALRVHPRTLENEMARGMRSIPMRVRIENHLRLPFWTRADEFVRRQRITEKIGVDPWLLTVRELHRRATEARLPGRGYAANKTALVELITAHHLSAATSNPTPPPPVQTPTPAPDHVNPPQQTPS